jgi:hypothetical protein
MSILCDSDTEFSSSRMAEHYTPPKQESMAKRVVFAISSLSLFAALGIIFAVGFSGCGGSGDDEEQERSSINPPQCAAHPEFCK